MTSVYAPDGAPRPDPAYDLEPDRPSSLDTGLAMLGYFLLFFTIFFAGVPAFIAVILAYARKGEAAPVTRSHLRYQIRIFWWCFWLTLLAVAALMRHADAAPPATSK